MRPVNGQIHATDAAELNSFRKEGQRFMPLQEWTLSYFEKGIIPSDDGQTFGCSAGGITGSWSIRPFGEVLAGTYENVLLELADKTATGFHADAAIVFFAKAPGMEEFLRQASRLLPGVPFGGGGAAFQPGAGAGELLPSAKDAVLLLIQDVRYHFTNVWANVHDDTGRKVQFRAGGERVILSLRENDGDVPALGWYSSRREESGFSQENFENLALSSPEGWNLHVSPEGEFALHTGANLPGGGELFVRQIDSDTASLRISAFCGNENTLIFGCAGLQSMLAESVQCGVGTFAGFLHGEVLTVEGNPRFTNLMMSGLRAEKIG